jgi:folate-binding protein YgfZ
MQGADRAEFLHNYTTQDIKALKPGGGCTSAISNWRGTVTDFVRILARPDDLLIIGSPGRQGVVKKALEQFIIGVDVRLEDVTEQIAVLEIWGPHASKALGAVRDLALDAHRTVQFAPALIEMAERDNPLADADAVADTVADTDADADADTDADADAPVNTSAIVVRTRGACGDGALVLVPAAADHAMRDRLRRLGATAIGDQAREIVRIAEGIPEFGKDIGEDTNVWEARLDGSVSMQKGCYLGQEIVARLFNYQKVQRYLMGLAIEGSDPVDPGAEVFGIDGASIGHVTSAAPSETGGIQALAMLRQAAASAGTGVRVSERAAIQEDRAFWMPGSRPN